MANSSPTEEEKGTYAGIFMILPRRGLGDGFLCWKEWCEINPSHACGCPSCLREARLTLIYLADDYDRDIPDDMWRTRVVALEVARYRPDLVVPGYPTTHKM
jgi:hypothetical protein